MADYKTILYQKQRHGVLITLNRPNALNAMNQEMMNDLDAALAEAETKRPASRRKATPVSRPVRGAPPKPRKATRKSVAAPRQSAADLTPMPAETGGAGLQTGVASALEPANP